MIDDMGMENRISTEPAIDVESASDDSEGILKQSYSLPACRVFAEEIPGNATYRWAT